MWMRRPREADAEYRPDPGHEMGKLRPDTAPSEPTDEMVEAAVQVLHETLAVFTDDPSLAKAMAHNMICAALAVQQKGEG